MYKYENDSWSKLGSDIDGEAAVDFSGYSVSINSAGTIVAIGAYENNGAGSNSGHVRVYEYDDAEWKQLGDDIDGEASNDNSGHSVSMNSDGTIVAIGAIGSGNGAGQVRVFEYDNGSWFYLSRGLRPLLSLNYNYQLLFAVLLFKRNCSRVISYD